MKNLYCLIIVLIAWTAIPAFAQKHSLNNKKDNLVHRPMAFKPSPGDERNTFILQKSLPLGWMEDSTYYSSWNTSSTDWDLYGKNFKTYNANGQTMVSFYIEFDRILLEWDNSFRYLYLYYPSRTSEMFTTQTWDKTLSSWKNVVHFHYNDNGKTDTTSSMVYDQIHHRYNSGSKSIYTYNVSGQNIEIINQVLDTVTSSWKNQSSDQFTFDAGNHITEVIHQDWVTGLNDWVNSIKSDYSFDGSGYATGTLEYIWDNAGSTWVYHLRGTFTNNASGYPVTELHEIWDAGASSWENLERETYQYNPDNQVTQYLDEDWDDALLNWVNYSKDTYSYYSNGNQDEYTGYFWNPISLSFMDVNYIRSDSSGYELEYYSKSIDWTTYQYTDGYKYIYTYNTFHNTDQILEQSLNVVSLAWYDFSRRQDTYDANQNCTVELDQNYDTLSLAWTNTYKQDHFYSYSSGIHGIPGTSEYCYFSNPAEAGERIVCPNLMAGKTYFIYLDDLQGRRVYTTNIHPGESFTVPGDLASGMYMMQLLEDGKIIAAGKLIIRQ